MGAAGARVRLGPLIAVIRDIELGDPIDCESPIAGPISRIIRIDRGSGRGRVRALRVRPRAAGASICMHPRAVEVRT